VKRWGHTEEGWELLGLGAAPPGRLDGHAQALVGGPQGRPALGAQADVVPLRRVTDLFPPRDSLKSRHFPPSIGGLPDHKPEKPPISLF